jgi:hypothetical protein
MTQMRRLLFGVIAAASACTPFLGPPPDGGDSAAAKKPSGGEDAAVDGPVDHGGGGATGVDAAVQDSAAQEIALETRAEVGAGPAVCGDGIPTLPEECDLGTAANTGAYGGCTKDCKLAPHCGDGKINDASEVCDDGENNGFGTGNCNPACSGVVTEKILRTTDPLNTSGIEDADLICQTYVGSQYRALLVDGTNRVASKNPYRGDGQVDWVLLPYTRYLNQMGALVWVTDDVALLGVRNGRPSSLLNPIVPVDFSVAWAGVQQDWTTSAETCQNWFSGQKDDEGAVFRLDLQTFEVETATCDQLLPIVCAERY